MKQILLAFAAAATAASTALIGLTVETAAAATFKYVGEANPPGAGELSIESSTAADSSGLLLEDSSRVHCIFADPSVGAKHSGDK